MRTLPAVCILTCAAHANPVAAADERYVVNILNHKGTRWTGVVSLSVSADETVAGELCLVRAESERSAAFPRMLLKVPLVGKRSRDGMDLRLPTVENGPVFKAGAAGLQLLSKAASNLVPAGSWQFGDLGTDEKEPRKSRRETSDYARFMVFTRDPELLAELTSMTGAKLSEVSVYRTPKHEESGSATSIGMSAYDALNREQVHAFERSRIMADVYTDGVVLAVADTAKIPMIQTVLNDLGDGARVLNAELAGCPSARTRLTVSVPAGLEYWYTRRLQRSGVVEGAYPDVQPRDPFSSVPYVFAPASLRSPLRNRQSPLAARYEATWESFERTLQHFAQVRRPGFAQSGTVAAVSSKTGPLFRAEIKGRAIAVCDANRWEWITVNATVLSLDAIAGKATISVNFSDGFEGRGATLPSDTRFKDNRISDVPLGEIQGRFVSVTENGAVPKSTISCKK